MAIRLTVWAAGKASMYQGTFLQVGGPADTQSPAAPNQLVNRSLSTPRAMVQVPPYSELAVGITPGRRARLRPTLKIFARKRPMEVATTRGPLCQSGGTTNSTDSSTTLPPLTIPIDVPDAVWPAASLIISGSPVMLKPTRRTG